MIEFRRAQTEDEMAAMYRLRYEVYCIEKRFLNADDYPDQLEHDEWDKYSTHFIATDGTDIVGTVRLIKESPMGFPAEKHFGVERPKTFAGALAEVSRLIVHPRFRKLTFQISNGLYRAILDYSRDKEITHWYAILDERLYTAYRRFGFTFKRVGEARQCLGDITSPYALSLEEMLDNLKVVNSRMYEFLTRPLSKDIVGIK